DEVTIETLFNLASGIADRMITPTSLGRAHLPGCTLASGAANCARKAILDLARRAWRRPLDDEEKTSLAAAVDEAARMGGTAQDGVKLAVRSMLSSPNFVFRVEVDEAGASHRVSAHELATRLSYFLYSSMPDAELSERADDGSLLDRSVFDAQIDRM